MTNFLSHIIILMRQSNKIVICVRHTNPALIYNFPSTMVFKIVNLGTLRYVYLLLCINKFQVD